MFSLISLFFLRWSSPNCFFFSSILKIYYWILSSGFSVFFLGCNLLLWLFSPTRMLSAFIFFPWCYYFLTVVFCVWCLSLNRETSVIGVASLFLVCVSQKQKKYVFSRWSSTLNDDFFYSIFYFSFDSWFCAVRFYLGDTNEVFFLFV